MNHIPLSEAKAHLSALVDAALDGKPSLITRHGKKEVVLISYKDWQKFSAMPSLWSLLTNAPVDGSEFERNRSTMRKTEI